jgi:hypothetical protein
MAKAIAVRLEDDSRERYISAAEIAAIYVALDDKATAVHWLNKAYEERASALIYINVDPVFDHMQNDPGFLSIAHRVLPGRP